MTTYAPTESGLGFLLRTAAEYERPGFFMLFAAVALIVTASMGRRDGRVFFFYPFVILLGTVFNPLLLEVLIGKELLDGQYYYRLFWLIPYPLTIGFGTIVIAYRVKKGAHRNAVYTVVSLALILTSLPMLMQLTRLHLPTDINMADEQVQMICNYIQDKGGLDHPLAAFEDEELRIAAREYAPGLEISHLLERPEDSAGPEMLLARMDEMRTDYVVVRKEGEVAAELDNLKKEPVAFTRDYLIYSCK